MTNTNTNPIRISTDMHNVVSVEVCPPTYFTGGNGCKSFFTTYVMITDKAGNTMRVVMFHDEPLNVKANIPAIAST